MTTPGDEIQRGIYAALTSAGAIASAFGQNPVRVYDDVPPPPSAGDDPSDPAFAVFPYLTIGEEEHQDASDQCHDTCETFAQVHVWSQTRGRLQAKRLAAAVSLSLDAPIAIPGRTLILHQWRSTRDVGDPDRVTKHLVVTLRYLTCPAP